VSALAICAFTAAGHDSPVATAEWAAGYSLAEAGGPRRAARPADLAPYHPDATGMAAVANSCSAPSPGRLVG
jgi:hypothetical protein